MLDLAQQALEAGFAAAAVVIARAAANACVQAVKNRCRRTGQAHPVPRSE